MYMEYCQWKRKHADSNNNPMLVEYPRSLDYTCVYLYMYICIDINMYIKYGGKTKARGFKQQPNVGGISQEA